ncbi:MAG: cell surface protein SprA [Flavobacteriales bacterium]
MRFKARNTIRLAVAVLLVITVVTGYANSALHNFILPVILDDSDFKFRKVEQDTTDLPFPLQDQGINPSENGASGINLQDPDNIQSEVIYDPETGTYSIVQTIGDSLYYRTPIELTQEEYLDYDFKQNLSKYWNKQQEELDEENQAFAPKMTIDSKGFENIFGSNEIEIRPQGSAELSFGINVSKTDNPRIPERQRSITTFDFDQRIQLNVVGNIGTKLQLSTNYNTEATFDFENQMKLEYTGDEDEIIQKIEAGNVSLPLSGSLIQGSQSLFGVKLETKWGRLRNTTVLTQQKGERKEINVEGGAQTQTFDIGADAYEANKHYFLSEYFRDQYNVAMQSLPIVNSNVNITRIEVWVVNTQANTQDVRNLVAFTDLGENIQYASAGYNTIGDVFQSNPSGLPDNEQNTIYQEMVSNDDVVGYNNAISAIQGLTNYTHYQQGIHYERVGNARKLNPSEFTFNSRLGFVSLRQSLNNAEVLAVGYEYTQGGQTYQVGTLSQDGIAAPNALILKMLKSSITQVVDENNEPAPLWELMMKNVYSIGAFGVNSEDFRLNVWYNNPSTGIFQNYIPVGPLDGKLLVQVLDMDKINVNGEPFPDGVFDFVDNAATLGGLINSQNGRLYLPTVEPFGEHLANYIDTAVLINTTTLEEEIFSQTERQAFKDQIVFRELYDSTKTAAQQIPAKNRFSIKGQYKSSSSSEISLNSINIPQGSVSVTAGGVRLVENQDYTVDYNLGRVRIINDALLDSGTPISVSLESNSLFNIQTKTLLGSRFDYEVNDDFNIGATILNLRERPLTQKINIGDEPVNNTIVGADIKYRTDSRFLTTLVDKLPFYETKATSTIDFNAEGAYLIPGYSRAIGKNGNAYIDDFEGSQSTIDLRALNQWFLASTPRHQPDLFPESAVDNQLKINYNRAKMSWYQIDPIFYQPNSNVNGVDVEARSDHRMREILEEEVFPDRELSPGTPRNIATLDMTFYPEERGQYNYDLPSSDPNLGPESAGLTPDGLLEDPESRWAGIQRPLTVNDFEASNIEFIQFWVMDPFNEDSENETGGDLYFNLGNVSEDVLSDSGLSFENGFPSESQPETPLDSTIWGFYPDPSNFNVVNAFDNLAEDYDLQDIGIDGLVNEDEAEYFENEHGYITALQNSPITSEALDRILADVSADNYEWPRRDIAGDGLNTLDRHRSFNGYEGNALNQQEAATTIPNTEDINRDNTLNTIESYYQYKVSLRPQDLDPSNVGKNYLTDVFQTTKNTDAQDNRPITWYQFKIPVRDFDGRFNGITDFRSIRFMRMFMKDWDEEVTLRFARLELIRGEWRRYLESLEGPNEINQNDDDETTFVVNAVNIEENSNREPVRYVEPPGIIREIDVGAANLRNLNEQSLSLEVCNLKDGDSRAAYRNVNFDMRLYERLKMFVHAESADLNNLLEFGDISAFIRLGSDFDENYYEYEIPLTITDLDATIVDDIWPEDNIMDIELALLKQAKVDRNNSGTSENNSLQIYETPGDGNSTIRVKGNPNLASVVTVMIGIKNPDKDLNAFAEDDGLSECAVVWANELRLTDFNDQGGGAALATVTANLADFGNVSLAGSISTPGFGSLEQRIQERQRETNKTFDASGTFQLGKLFGEKIGLQLPVYLGYSTNITDPQFDPRSPDVELLDVYSDITDAGEREDKKNESRTTTTRRTINFSNVSINPQSGGGKKEKGKDGKSDPKKDVSAQGSGGKGGGSNQTPFYSVKNFSVGYTYTDINFTDINTEKDLTVEERANLNYTFSYKPVEVKPFEKIGFIKDKKALRFIKDFNFNIGPKLIGFTTQTSRMYQESEIRNEFAGESNFDAITFPQIVKRWDWTRAYNFRYDLTKSLKFDFNANNQALMREPQGLREDLTDVYWDQVSDLNGYQNNDLGGVVPGITTGYDQGFNVSYKLPLDKFPIVNFISADARYSGTYRWTRAPFAQDTLGNTIQNSRNITLNAQANFSTLYGKSDFLKALERGKKPKSKKDKKKKEEEIKEDEGEVDGFGEKVEEEKKKKKKDQINPLHELIKIGMMVKNVSGNYSRVEGTLLPGYNLDTYILGMDRNFDGPGVGFLLGQQQRQLFGNVDSETGLLQDIASQENWLVQVPTLNILQSSTYTENYNFRANIEPFKDFKIELNMNESTGVNQSGFFVYNEELDDGPGWEMQSPVETGNYSASIIAWSSAFVRDDPDDNFSNQIYTDFLDNRTIISERVSQEYDNETGLEDGYYTGYGPLSQRVIIPAFVAAYTGQDASSVSTNPLKTRVAPNWTVRYNGLTKIKSMKKIFKQFRINHSYKANYTTSYITDAGYRGPEATGENFQPEEDLDQAVRPNFIDPRQIGAVTMVEQLSPLLGFDMTINKKNKNRKPIDPQVKIEFRRDRTITLGLANFQITETKSNSMVIGIGGKIPEVPIDWLRGKNRKKSRLPGRTLENSPINIRADLTIRDNVTIIRRIEERQNQITAGQRIFSLKTSADLQVSNKLTVRFFYDHQITEPKISTSFRTTNISSGIALRFTLTQ